MYAVNKDLKIMLTFAGSEEKHNTCFKFIGADTKTSSTNLISDNTSLISSNTSLISTALSNGGMDTCSFYSGPSDSTIMAFGESFETCGSIAYSGGETCGSIAYSGGGESCGSVASSSAGSSMGGGCSYSC